MKKSVLSIAFATCSICLLLISAAAKANLPLSSESIAGNAMRVAQATGTTGRCYAAVSRALNPLGVELSGMAAYQARDLLFQDKRFIALSINNVEQLRRGDIIVYNRSQSHPYGHIAVYLGKNEEASDHLAPITHTRNYGGAIVFRLAEECKQFEMAQDDLSGQALSSSELPVPAPPYRRAYRQTAPQLQQIQASNKPVSRSFLRRIVRVLVNKLL